MENMTLYNMGAPVPEEAKKPITGGRLKGFTDINPMWRIKRLTEMFGACGIGWWYEITDKRLEQGKEGEIRAFVDIKLFYIYGGQISQPIPGTGGSSFSTKESSGVYVSDECFKMALTDAISVAAKALGIGSEVYYAKDRDKYTQPEEQPQKQQKPQQSANKAEKPQLPPVDKDGYWKCVDCGGIVTNTTTKEGKKMLPNEVVEIAMKRYGRCLCAECMKKAKAAQDAPAS